MLPLIIPFLVREFFFSKFVSSGIPLENKGNHFV